MADRNSSTYVSRPSDSVSLKDMMLLIDELAVNNDNPLLFWGPPGIGKTQGIISHFVKDLGYHEVRQVVVSMIDAVEARGIPFVVHTEDEQPRTEWAVSSLFAVPKGKKVAFFLDELPNAMPAQAAPLQKIIHEKKVDNVDIRGCPVIAAGNDVTHAAGTHTLSSAMANRWSHFNVWPSVDEFLDYAVGAGFHEWVVGYLRWQKQAPKTHPDGSVADPLIQFEPKKSGRAWRSPRTIEYASDVLKSKLPDHLKRRAVEGAAGENFANELFTYSAIWSQLPDITGILDGKDIPVPTRPDLLYATIGAIVGRLVAMCPNKTETEMRGDAYKPDAKLVAAVNAALEYALKIGDTTSGADFTVVLVKDLANANNGKIRWATKHKPFGGKDTPWGEYTRRYKDVLDLTAEK